MTWKEVWRDGIAPLLSTEGLQRLRDALANDDPRLIQGQTTVPPPLQCVQDWPVEAACGVSFCGWTDNATVADVEEFFARTCFDCDQRLSEPAACRHFLNWFDETPREAMRQQLLAEVDSILSVRIPCETHPS